MAKINGVVASWSMIRLLMSPTNHNAGGFTGDSSVDESVLLNCTSIKWNTNRKVEDIYGIGGMVRGRGFGNVTQSASITIPYSTVELLVSKSATGTLMGLGEFNIVVSWQTEAFVDATSMNQVTLAGCFFSEMGMESSQDDTSISREYDLHPYRIWNSKFANLATKPQGLEMSM